ncbi:unnamed protein product [Zymoseptoria tritici ST99CH_1A5]|uniref:F-box domain-containing protein n=1 Tax=Zymoseptoria tritici ST99CH_1A5 TaxID=1276529 RepID=A0A1Y6LTY3_ZYMTR|nr:unnamed protein product [Zymoseptoria tritici ST99CH_1A5]
MELVSEGTPSPPAPIRSAAERLFETTEILEQILLNVNDMRTLLLSQRVSKLFVETITGSKALQETLFFRIRPANGNRKVFGSPYFINKLLCAPGTRSRIGLNFARIHQKRRAEDRWYLDIDIIFDTLARLKQLEETDWEGSWRRMLIVQPTSVSEDVWHLSYAFDETSRWTTAVGWGNWRQAVTMDELVRTLLERAERKAANPWEVKAGGPKTKPDKFIRSLK